MSKELVCPFCQQELDYLAEDIYGNMYCPNCCDKNGFTYIASESIWQELIKLMENKDLSDKIGKLELELERTRKALDVAVDGLGKMTWGCDSSDAELLLKEIKEILEQKD